MAETGFSAFDTMVDKTNRILREIEQAYGWPSERRQQSYTALRAVLHQLRDRLSTDEAVQLGAQLPTLVRGIYYDGWKPSATPVKMDRDEFLNRIRQEFPYSIEGDIEQLVYTVLTILKNHTSEGEWEDLRARMPKTFSTVMP